MRTSVRQAVHRAAPRLARPRTRLPPGQPYVALTFDDGPDPVHTARVLDVLAGAGAVATFFLVGAAAAAEPGLVRRIVGDGHAVGMHSYGHPAPWTTDLPSLLADYRSALQVIEAAAGRPVRLFRPPRGHLGLWESVAVARLRLRCWLWSRDLGDWRPGVGPDDLVAAAGPTAAGDVLLLHDALFDTDDPAAHDRSATVEALPAIIDLVRRRGLGFARLDGGSCPT